MKGYDMEKKLKIAECAALIGITAKTVYKMVEREEIKTVSEKVNNRSTMLVITNDAEIEKFKNIYGKNTVNNGNYEDMLTENEAFLNFNNASQNSINADYISEIFDKVFELNKEYNTRITKLSEELTNTKAQMLYLEDKAGREGMYLNDIKALKTENEQLRTSKKKIFYTLLTVIILFSLFLVGYLSFNIALSKKNAEVTQEIVNPE